MIEKLTQWLERQGFSLELRTASAFRRAGFNVRQSAYYFDRGTGKEREIDVVAVQEDEEGAPLVYLAIECKSSDKPWVVLKSPNTLANVPRWLCWGILTHEGVDTFASGGVVVPEEFPWYQAGDACGYSLRKAFVERDDGFAAAAAVLKAAQYLVLPMQMDARPLPPYAVAFPVIVVDTPIFECDLNDHGEIELRGVTRSEFYFEDHSAFDAAVRIRVIHINAMDDFAQEAHSAAKAIHQMLGKLPAPRILSTRLGA